MATLYQLELDYRDIDCGMSYVFHLDDGRFFLIDGGYFTPEEEDRLYEFLYDLAGSEPHIAGWFFSHAHQDHIGNFINFTRKYTEKFRLDALLYNFQPMDFSGLDEDADWRGSDPATFREFYVTVDKYYSAVPRYIIKTGDQYAFGELLLDVLYTQEDLYPVESRFNDYSSVIRITAGGQRLLFLGDIYTEASRILLQEPGALRCDIVQVAHHGFSGATEALYRATGAKVALWPTPAYVFELFVETPKRAANEYLLRASGVAEHLVSGHGTAALPLPYEIGGAKRFPRIF